MNKTIPIDLLQAKGAYGRGHEAAILLLGVCSVCKARAKPGLWTDGSGGEYGGPAFCVDCLKDIIGKIERAEFSQPLNYQCTICLQQYDAPPDNGRIHVCSPECWDTLASWNQAGIDWENQHPLKCRSV